MPASVQLLRGEARLTLGEDVHEVEAGAFAYMPPPLNHAITAKTPVVMLLHIYK